MNGLPAEAQRRAVRYAGAAEARTIGRCQVVYNGSLLRRPRQSRAVRRRFLDQEGSETMPKAAATPRPRRSRADVQQEFPKIREEVAATREGKNAKVEEAAR